jgi:adenylosuccinate synthase
MVDVLLGLQWGDEGKGKIVDYLAAKYDIVARFQGGPNAGHTLYLEDKKYVLHTIPSGIFRTNVQNVIGNGVVIDPTILCKEIDQLSTSGVEFLSRLYIAKKAHLILPSHRFLDAVMEAEKGAGKIGSTLKGIGPTYTDKVARHGLRIGDVFLSDFKARYNKLKENHLRMASIYPAIDFDLEGEEKIWMESIERLKKLQFIDSSYFINDAIKAGKKILAEGAQGSMLDIDYGTYPFVTSSNTITSGVCNGLGLAPQKIGEVIGITKAYCTRVGSGPFPTELHGEKGEEIRKAGGEFGATTGRPRRCGWIDLPQLKYTIMINGVTQLVMTKADVLDDFEEISAAIAYKTENGVTDELPFDMVTNCPKPVYKAYKGWKKDLTGIRNFADFPTELQDYVQEMEDILEVPFSILSVGPGREQLVLKPTKAMA